MNRTFLTCLSIILICTSFKRTRNPEGFSFIRREIGLNLYCGQTEVTNAQYAEFLEHLKAANDTAKLRECRVYDELWGDWTYRRSQKKKWNNKTGHFEYVDTLHHLAKEYSSEYFKDFPVVNISHNAAKQYCEWLTDKWKEIYKAKPGRHYGDSLRFRLPSEVEWEHCATGGMDVLLDMDTVPYPWGNGSYKNSEGQYLANFMRISQDSFILTAEGKIILNPIDSLIYAENWLHPVPVRSYNPNDYGLWCMAGNVAEMTEDFYICKGGSFHSIANNLIINASELYLDPSPCKGFRVIADIYGSRKP